MEVLIKRSGRKGKKSRKHGRNKRRPATAKRKMTRPDLNRKFKRVLKGCGLEFAREWVKLKLSQGEPVEKFLSKVR